MTISRLSLSLTTVALAVVFGGCGDFYENGGDDGDHFRRHDRRGGRDCNNDNNSDDEDAGANNGSADAGASGDPDSGASSVPDAGATGDPDAGSSTDSGVSPPECSESPECPDGKQCVEGACVPCEGGVCLCDRDDDCPSDWICDHAAGECGPRILRCEELADEPACLLRADCRSIYAGMNCTDANGGECTSQDPDCTCESFVYDHCARRDAP